ncbi:MAG: hypothetical protein ACYSOI_09715 [Planctomycetota bacterium]
MSLHFFKHFFFTDVVEDIVVIDLPVEAAEGAVVAPGAGRFGSFAKRRDADAPGGQVGDELFDASFGMVQQAGFSAPLFL